MKPQDVMILFLSLIGTSRAQIVCPSSPSSPQTGYPKLPFISPSYQATIAIAILDKNYSMVIDQHVDFAGHRAALTVHKGSTTEKLIFSYDTDEVFDIINQNCKIYAVDSNPYSFLMRSANGANGQRGILDVVTSITNYSANKPVYNGTGTVRGIPSDVWSTCLSWQSTNLKLQASYYFSRLGWKTFSPQQQTLLRIEVKGMSNSGPTNSAYFHHVYDFISYLPYIDADASIFSSPPRVVCLNLKSQKTAPSFKYRAEIVDSRMSYISHYAVWYDGRYKMLREDSRTRQTFSGYADLILNTTTEIRDFNTGVQYKINSTGCSIKAIGTSDTDEDVARFKYNGTLVVDVRDPNSFFVSNGSYAYIGKRAVRGITCDIFSAVIANFPLDGAKYDAVYEYAFLEGGWNDLPLYGTETYVHRYPVQLLISIPSVEYNRVYNFFEFSEDVDTYPTFDISNCYGEKQKLGFQITFPGANNLGLQERWIAAIYTSLVQVMNIFPIRVGGITISNDEGNIHVNAYVLTSSALANFEKLQFSLEEENDKFIKGVTTADECAVLCIDNTDFLCESFQYCEYDGFACRMSRNYSAANRALFNATACDSYTRNNNVAPKKEPLLSEAYSLLLNAVQLGNLQITITDTQGNALPTYTALGVQLTSGNLLQGECPIQG